MLETWWTGAVLANGMDADECTSLRAARGFGPPIVGMGGGSSDAAAALEDAVIAELADTGRGDKTDLALDRGAEPLLAALREVFTRLPNASNAPAVCGA